MDLNRARFAVERQRLGDEGAVTTIGNRTVSFQGVKIQNAWADRIFHTETAAINAWNRRADDGRKAAD